MFENYKSIILLKYMRTIKKNPAVVTSKDPSLDKMSMNTEQVEKVEKGNQVKIKLFSLFI